MKKSNILIIAILFIVFSLTWADLYSEDEIRQNVTELLRSAGLDKKSDSPVRVSVDDSRIFNISDEGKFFMQYIVRGAQISSDVNVEIDPNLVIGSLFEKTSFIRSDRF